MGQDSDRQCVSRVSRPYNMVILVDDELVTPRRDHHTGCFLSLVALHLSFAFILAEYCG